MAGWISNGAPTVGITGNTPYPQLLGYERITADTSYVNGVTTGGQNSPATAAAHAFDIASLYVAISGHTASATAGAATLNTPLGQITSESITTAAAASYTLTLTNSVVAATSNCRANAYLKSSTTGGPLLITSITPAAGSVVIVVKNNGSAALNGTIVVNFMVSGAI
jgi:hypothetical protein